MFLPPANALLLLTTRPKFSIIAFENISESAKSSATHSDKVPSEELASALAHTFPNANEIQMDLLLANQ